MGKCSVPVPATRALFRADDFTFVGFVFFRDHGYGGIVLEALYLILSPVVLFRETIVRVDTIGGAEDLD